MRKQTTLTHRRLTEVLTYRPRLGKFLWEMSIATHIVVGSEAGTLDAGGRRIICIDGELYKAAVLAWFHIKKRWPRSNKLIDHKDRNKSNDRWNNLREVSPLQSSWNRNYKRRTVGVTQRKSGKYRVRIGYNNSRKLLGEYDTLAKAISAYRKAFRELHGKIFKQGR